MIDDTGTRITALERRVATLEREAVRFADLREILNETGSVIHMLEAEMQARGGGVVTEPDVQAKAADGTTANGKAATPTPSPSLAEAMEALRDSVARNDAVYESTGVATAELRVVIRARAVLSAWDRERPDEENAWKARAEAADKLLRDVVECGWLDGVSLRDEVRAHLQKGTP